MVLLLWRFLSVCDYFAVSLNAADWNPSGRQRREARLLFSGAAVIGRYNTHAAGWRLRFDGTRLAGL